MLNYTELICLAKAQGFTNAGPLDVPTLLFLPEVREMCASDRCHSYGKNWTCPPACGTLDDMREKIMKYSGGLLVQTVGQLEDGMDWENMQKALADHTENLLRFQTALKNYYPGLLALGAGPCTRCEICAYPDGKPCRFPDQLMYSMEACGLFVSKVCSDNHLDYNHGTNTVTYTGCFLLE